MKKLLLLLVMILLPIMASADDSGTCGENLTWNYEESTKTLTISGTGAMTDYTPELSPWYENRTKILKLVLNDGITSIGNYAFVNCSITSVTIPNSVTSIGEMAFYRTSLTSITIPNSVTSIDKNAFTSCEQLTSITIPNSVTSIGDYAFSDCSITSVTIPNSVTSIGKGAFSRCKSLASVSIPNSVTDISEGAFSSCSSLTSITIPNNVTAISEWAFYQCKGLTSVTIPNSVTSIGDYAFRECTSLASVTIPNSVTSIGGGAFYESTGLTSVNIIDLEAWCKMSFRSAHANPLYYAKHLYLNGKEVKDLVIPNSVTTIEAMAFSRCEGLTSVTIPNSVTSIGGCAFEECKGLTFVTIPNSVTSIGGGAFGGCTGLTAVNITDLEAWCKTDFVDRDSNPLLYAKSLILNGTEIKDLVIPNSVTSIGQLAFYGNISLTSVTIPNSVTSIGQGAFSYCSGLTSLSIPNSVISIGDAAFSNCSGLTSVTIPNSVTSIGQGAFSRCKSLASVSIPNSVTSIGSYAFSRCSSLSSVTIPNSVTAISEGAFSYTGLVNITIPKSVVDIQSEAFRYCLSLTEVYCYAATPPDVNIYSFTETPVKKVVLYVPKSAISSYRLHSRWNQFKAINKIPMPEYTLTYLLDGKEYKTYKYEEGETITPETSVMRVGYTFSGWSEIPKTMPAKDVTVTGTFCVNKYKLIYKVDGAGYKTYEVEYGATITAEPAPTKEGYTFSGWSEIPETMPAKDVTVTGTFSINKYKLIYKVDGADYKTYDVEYGAAITADAAPIKEGYSFSGWSDIPATMPANDVTVTGTFAANKYKLVYQVDGANYKSCEVEYGATITPEAAPTKVGHTFSGWGTIPATMPAHDVYVNGTFSKGNYKLTYKVDGTEYKTISYDYGTPVTPETTPIKEGYTFSGWSDIPATMPANDVTVTGTFAVNKYKLVYQVDGEDYKNYEVEYGATITPEANPTKVGHTFSGWGTILATMPAHDVYVNGTFSINNYKLIYKIDGVDYKTISYDYGTPVTPEDAPIKEGYTFSGWSEIPATMPANDVTVTGTFAANKYKLVYQVDGADYKSCEVEYGATITPEVAPTKEGHIFSGWGTIPETMPAHDVYVNGTFSKGNYMLTYKVDGTEYKTISYDYGTPVTPEDAPIKEGYTFSGWSEIPATMPANDVTVTGTFAANKYKLVYQVDGANYKSCEVEYGATITPEAAPTREGYTFSGWSEIPATMPASDVAVTGTFAVNKYKLVYQVDGANYKSYEVEYGATITPEAVPTREGYTFSGWSEIPATMPAKGITITGTFSVNKYKLVYMVDGAEYKIYEVEYGSSITPEATPTKEHYTFSGWSTIPSTMPAKDVTITGTFSADKFHLIYKVDGVEYKNYDVGYGSTITPEAAPTKEGYSFSGWSDIPSTMPANDVTITGTFSINKYKLIYKVDGTEYKSYDVEYGATITPEAAPTKEGYTFSGWSEIPKTMPAKDVTVTGTLTIETVPEPEPEPTPESEGTAFEEDVDDSASKETIVTFTITEDSSSDTPTVSISSDEDGVSGQLEIPETVKHNGVEYKVTEISDGAFQNNTALMGVTIPASIVSIGENAFAGCSNLKSITIFIVVPINLSTASSRGFTRAESGSVFAGVDKNTCILYVPDGSVDKYKAAPVWCEFKNILPIKTSTGIQGIEMADGETFDVFTLSGQKVKSQTTSLDGLPRGIYIVKGKKVMKK